ncbi:hypothetical protein LJB78_00960 [Bacteroidales bacterium OttesenSCG-928-J16]|nr:hypothetical protein [Bacteroidales bacterium OttesenSCG-928-J16]
MEKDISTLGYPLEIDFLQCKLYLDKFVFKDKEYKLDQILSLGYHSSSESINGITISTSQFIYLIIMPKYKDDLIINEDEDCETIRLFYPSVFKNRKSAQFFNFYCALAQLTRGLRLQRYLNTIKRCGMFAFGNNYLCNNGDIITADNKLVINLCEAKEGNLINYGETYRGLKASECDPFTMIIYFNTSFKFRFFGFDLSKNEKIDMSMDKDCLDIILAKLFKDKKICELDENKLIKVDKKKNLLPLWGVRYNF